jgi:hypothetical protein
MDLGHINLQMGVSLRKPARNRVETVVNQQNTHLRNRGNTVRQPGNIFVDGVDRVVRADSGVKNSLFVEDNRRQRLQMRGRIAVLSGWALS